MKLTLWIVVVIGAMTLGAAVLRGGQEFDGLARRVQQLEGQAAGGDAALDVIRAKQFHLEDESGDTRATLGMFRGQAVLGLFDENSNVSPGWVSSTARRSWCCMTTTVRRGSA